MKEINFQLMDELEKELKRRGFDLPGVDPIPKSEDRKHPPRYIGKSLKIRVDTKRILYEAFTKCGKYSESDNVFGVKREVVQRNPDLFEEHRVLNKKGRPIKRPEKDTIFFHLTEKSFPEVFATLIAFVTENYAAYAARTDTGADRPERVLSSNRSPGSSATQDSAEVQSWADQAVREGEHCIASTKRAIRDRKLIGPRLRLDNRTCQNCGFIAREEIIHEGELKKLSAVIVHVHHIDPMKEGERETRLEDLVTLCPNCHAILDAIGRATGAKRLDVELLKEYYGPHSKGE